MPLVPDTTMGYHSSKVMIGGGFMGGTIRCRNKSCNDRKMDPATKTCPTCGGWACRVVLAWKGKHYKYGHALDGDLLTYDRADKLLKYLQNQIDEDKDGFKPKDRLDGAIRERLFENKWDQFMADKTDLLKADERSPEYIRVLDSYRRCHYNVLVGYDVRSIDSTLLANIKRKMQGRKPKTKANVILALASFFNWLRDEDRSITQLPQFPEVDVESSTPQRAIDYDVQVEALKRIPQPYKDVIEFGMETGLRPGETCALKIGDIFLDRGEALIGRTWSGAKLRDTTKGGTKDLIPLSDRAWDIAREHCQGKHPEAFLFVNPITQGPFRRKRLGEVWNQYSGVPVKHYEASRHSFCTQMVESGAGEMEAQLLMRHKDAKTTRKYFHKKIDRLRVYVNKRGTAAVQPLRTKMLKKIEK